MPLYYLIVHVATVVLPSWIKVLSNLKIPSFAVIGMETEEELISVTNEVNKIITSSSVWVGGKYNSTSGKYYWVGSGIDGDVASMYNSYPPVPGCNLALIRPNPKLEASRSMISFASLCEEY